MAQGLAIQGIFEPFGSFMQQRFSPMPTTPNSPKARPATIAQYCANPDSVGVFAVSQAKPYPQSSNRSRKCGRYTMLLGSSSKLNKASKRIIRFKRVFRRKLARNAQKS